MEEKSFLVSTSFVDFPFSLILNRPFSDETMTGVEVILFESVKPLMAKAPARMRTARTQRSTILFFMLVPSIVATPADGITILCRRQRSQPAMMLLLKCNVVRWWQLSSTWQCSRVVLRAALEYAAEPMVFEHLAPFVSSARR